MKLQTLSEAITRRDFMRASSALAASALAGGLSSAAQAADAPASPSAQSAYPHPLLTPAEKFRDVSRGEPRPDTLKGDALVQARLTPETWRLEITADATPNPAIKESAGLSKPLTLTDGFYGDINPGISLAAPDPSGWVEFGGAGEVKFTFAENVSITKITSFGERLKLHLRADIFNFFNHPNFSNPATNISQLANVGVISGVGGVNGSSTGDQPGARAFRMGLRFEF